MGGNMSRVEDNGAYSTTTVSHAVHSPKYYNNSHRKKPFENNDISTSVEIIKAPPPASPPPFDDPRNYKSSSVTSRRKSPAAALVPTSNVGKVHRVIYFHSSPSCRGYLEGSKASNTLIVINFTNGWCGSCRCIEPTLHEFAAKYSNVEFLEINVDELPDIAQLYEVRMTPTFVLLKRGKLLVKVAGANKDDLRNKIENHRA